MIYKERERGGGRRGRRNTRLKRREGGREGKKGENTFVRETEVRDGGEIPE